MQAAGQQIESVLHEERRFMPPPAFAANSALNAQCLAILRQQATDDN